MIKKKNIISVFWSKIIINFGYKYDKSIIPNGPYCYSPDFEKNNNKSIDDDKYYIKKCKYYKVISKNWNGCVYCGIITDDYIFDDQCKICGVNDNDEDYK